VLATTQVISATGMGGLSGMACKQLISSMQEWVAWYQQLYWPPGDCQVIII
jgi:hypothetical protein